jgi:hypothetical protein
MKKLNIVFGVICLISGCSTEAIRASDANQVPASRVFIKSPPPSTATSTLVVTRDSGFVGSACNIGLFIDGDIVASLSTKESAAFKVAPGEHILGIGDPGKSAICFGGFGSMHESSSIFKDGETKYFRITIRMQTGPALEPTTLTK